MTPVAPSSTDFAHECTRITHDLQRSLRSLLESSPTQVERATDVQRVIEVAASLAWQVFRVSRSESLSEVARLVPLPDAMSIFLDAAQKKSFSKASLREVRTAYDDYDKFVDKHAGTRSAFQAMVSSLGEDESQDSELKTRRNAFRANAELWGLRASLVYRCLIITGTPDEAHGASVILQGTRKLQALKPNRTLPVCRRKVTVTLDADGVDRELIPMGTSILREFSSDPLPEVTTQIKGDFAHDYTTLQHVGKTAEVDLFVSTRMPSVLDPDERQFGLTSMIRIPADHFVADLLVPQGLMDMNTAKYRSSGCLEDVSAAENGEARFHMHASRDGEYVGNDIDALHDPVFPRCPELMRFVLRELGASKVTFDIFRCHVKFPLLHSCIGFDVQRK